ncbi:MAG: hypothetical protein JSW15_04990 [Deltaproteobacteria bacterium]|nr:MAG: hypothetical protein JSW15_04990 [Deltaproteobacteria bacterium]
MKSRVLGRHLYDDFSFNHVIDAVSSATITSSLIFNSLERADTTYQELKEKGYLK